MNWNWNVFYPVAIGILTVGGAGLAGHLAAKEWWHKWVFWGTAIIIVLLTYFQARSIKEPPTATEIAEAVAAKLQNQPAPAATANPKANEIANEVVKNIWSSQVADNKQMCARAFAVAKRMRDIESDAEEKRKKIGFVTSQAQIAAGERIADDEKAQFKEIYGEIMFVYGEMTARLKNVPDIPFLAQPVLQGGMMAGVDSLSGTAGYLEVLAKKLCPEN